MNPPILHVRSWPTLPANSQYAAGYNSTLMSLETYASAASVAALTVGSYRGMLAGVRISGYVRPSDQAITLHRCLLVNGAFESQFSVAVASTVSQPIDWKMDTGDWAVVVQAGPTAPTAIAFELVVVEDRS